MTLEKRRAEDGRNVYLFGTGNRGVSGSAFLTTTVFTSPFISLCKPPKASRRRFTRPPKPRSEREGERKGLTPTPIFIRAPFPSSLPFTGHKFFAPMLRGSLSLLLFLWLRCLDDALSGRTDMSEKSKDRLRDPAL